MEIDRKNIFLINKHNLSGLTLSFAMVLYALLSNPTPDYLGFTEVIIGLLLVLAVGFINGSSIALGQFIYKPSSSHNTIASLFFIVVFFVGVINSIIYGWLLSDIVRDLIAFIFFMSALFTSNQIIKAPWDWKYFLLPLVLSFNGVAFSIRQLLNSGIQFQDIGTRFYNSPEYFSTDASVLFAAIYLPLLGTKNLLKSSRSLFSILFIILGILAIFTLFSKGHRGPIGILFLVYTIYFFINLVKGRMFLVIMGLSIAAISITIFSDVIFTYIELLLKKHDKVGINMRDAEFMAVWDTISTSSMTVLTGLGWGSTFKNPAVSMIEVNFAHWIMSFFLLKSGLVGALLLVGYLFVVIKNLYQTFKSDEILGLAAAAPLAVGLLLNGSFRYLSFGFLILIISLPIIHKTKN